MIRKEGSGYSVFSKDGSKRLSKPSSKKAAVKRLQQIEYFKRMKKSKLEKSMSSINPSMNYEDMMTSLEVLAAASPADQEQFLKSIAQSEMGDQIREALKIHQEIKSHPGDANLAKSFKDAFDKLGKSLNSSSQV
ncbi:Uncharacterised protein [uncultured archaeon]|nr:Uncharacterised protein [uncultured archaeon]